MFSIILLILKLRKCCIPVTIYSLSIVLVTIYRLLAVHVAKWLWHTHTHTPNDLMSYPVMSFIHVQYYHNLSWVVPRITLMSGDYYSTHISCEPVWPVFVRGLLHTLAVKLYELGRSAFGKSYSYTTKNSLKLGVDCLSMAFSLLPPPCLLVGQWSGTTLVL